MEIIIEIISTVATVLAVVGVCCNNYKFRACFILWMFSNVITAGVHIYAELWVMVFRDAVFFALAVHGWRRWGRQAEPGIGNAEDRPKCERPEFEFHPTQPADEVKIYKERMSKGIMSAEDFRAKFEKD